MSTVSVDLNKLPGRLVPIAKAYERNWGFTDINTPAGNVETVMASNEHTIKIGEVTSALVPQTRVLGRNGFRVEQD